MSAKKTLYLANPYGFSAQQRSGPLASLVSELERVGAEVREPFSQTEEAPSGPRRSIYRTGQANLSGVRKADGFFGVVNGCPPDEGVMVELGLAVAWGKPVFLFRDDLRRCTDSDVYPLNLMLFVGLPEKGWDRHWYSDLRQLGDPSKALLPWLNGAGPATPGA